MRFCASPDPLPKPKLKIAMQKSIPILMCVGAMSILIARADTPPAKAPEQKQGPMQEPKPGALLSQPGYIPTTALPSSVSLVPEPPGPRSAAMAQDEEVSRNALIMHNTARWELAKQDAVLTFPALAQTFACALNVPVDSERTPKLIALLRRTFVDAGRATSDAKHLYQRTRPFMANEKPTCTPESEAGLRRDGSYPSGHSSIGWAIGLVLTEVSPDQADAILARGRAFGQSRLVCNVHWQSDVQAGQMVGSAVVARLHAEPAFRNDVEAARTEIAALRSKGTVVGRDCEAEARAIESWK
jgi:acid phosphatase (class A)